MPYITNSVSLFSFALKNSSQNVQFFKNIPANFGRNKEKYLPLHETPKSGSVFMLKVLECSVIEANLFNESTSIFPKNYSHSIKSSFHLSKKYSMENVWFQWDLKSYYSTKLWILLDIHRRNLIDFLQLFLSNFIFSGTSSLKQGQILVQYVSKSADFFVNQIHFG